MKKKLKSILDKIKDITSPLSVGLQFTTIFFLGVLCQKLKVGVIPVEVAFYSGSALFALYSIFIARAYENKTKLNKDSDEDTRPK